jgi:glutaredoxin
VLDLAQFNYVEYKLNTHFDKRGFYEEFGKGSSFPQVVLDGEKLGGCTQTIKYLKENQLLGSR